MRSDGSSEPSISSSTPSSRAFFIETRTGPSRSPSTRTRDANSSSARSRWPGSFGANSNPSGACSAQRRNCSSAGQPVPGRVQLDRVEPLRVEAEELLRIEPGRVEAGPPGRVRPPGGADRDAVYSGRSFGHDGNSDSSRRAVHGRGAGAARAALHEPRPARLRAREPAGDGEGRDVRPLLALRGDAAADVPRRVRRLGAGGARDRRRRGRARGAAVRAHLHRLRRRLGRAARRRASRVRVDVEPPDEDPAAAAARRVSRAVDALHRVRRRDRRVRLPLPPRRALRPAVRARDGRAVRDVRAPARRRHGVDGGAVSRRRTASRRPRIAAPFARRRSTSSAGCCPRRRCRTSASTAAARPTSSSSCICSRTRSRRRARTAR